MDTLCFKKSMLYLVEMPVHPVLNTHFDIFRMFCLQEDEEVLVSALDNINGRQKNMLCDSHWGFSQTHFSIPYYPFSFKRVQRSVTV